MSDRNLYQDKNYLRNSQYKTSNNLGARANLHTLFSTTKVGWFQWVLTQADLFEGAKVLEVGGGPGWLWRNTLAQLPTECEITATDFSPGMVAEAQEALSADRLERFRFQVVNIEEIPFADDSFDVVIGNHMLYHVPNLAKGLQEVGRVLKPNGRFLAATNGKKHMIELHELRPQLFPEVYQAGTYPLALAPLPFSLENGRSLLEPWFAAVEVRQFEDGLIVTEPEPLIDYILSSQQAQERVTPAMRDRARQELRAQIAQEGAIHIQKETGLFIAQL